MPPRAQLVRQVISSASVSPLQSIRTFASVTTSGHHEAHGQLIDAFQRQISKSCTISTFFIVDALRKAYPNHYLTQTYSNAGLLDFARSGALQADLDTTVGHYFTRTRDHRYERVTAPEHLKDDVQFGRFNCRWKGHDFYMYHIEWYQTDYLTERQFILFPLHDRAQPETPLRVVDALLVASFQHNADVGEEIWLYDRDHWSKNQRLFASVKKSSWDDVTLGKELKAELMHDVASFFDRRDHYESFGVPWKRGIILHGLPGNGKTISIKALMRSLAIRPQQVPTLYVKSLGSKADHDAIRDIFEKARETSPCLLVFEDLDSLVRENVRSFFLNEIDGLESNDGILMIGSTNYLDKLDPAISKRPSRFDRKYYFPVPAKEERLRYCEHWRSKLSRSKNVKLPAELTSKIASHTEGMSFAYLQEVLVSSMVTLIDDFQSAALPENGSSVGDSTSQQTAVTDAKRAGMDAGKIWKVISHQIAKIRAEMEESRKSVADASKNTVLSEVGTRSGRGAGFGI